MLDGENSTLIKVLGIGDGGSNAVNRMIEEGQQGVEFIAVNTNTLALTLSRASRRVWVGYKLTKGLGSGGDPNIGAKACEESSDDLHEVLSGSEMTFIIAAMGGGTGTGGAPVIARIARETGTLTIGVVTRPFTFEGSRRRHVACEGIERLKEHVDTLIVITNDRLLEFVDERASIVQAFWVTDDVIRRGIQGITELVTLPGPIRLEFEDVQVIMADGGVGTIAFGQAAGMKKAVEATQQAITSPLLEVSLDAARGILLNVTGGSDLSLYEVQEAAEIIRKAAHPEAGIIFGAVTDETMEDRARITVIATRLGPRTAQRPPWRKGRPQDGSPSPSLSPWSPPSPNLTHAHASRKLEES